MITSLGRNLLWQSSALFAGGAIVGALAGAAPAVAATYGGGVALANQAMLSWRCQAVAADGGREGRALLKVFYRSSLERFLLVAILLALWFLLIKSRPLAVLAGFLTGQLVGTTAGVALREGT